MLHPYSDSLHDVSWGTPLGNPGFEENGISHEPAGVAEVESITGLEMNKDRSKNNQV